MIDFDNIRREKIKEHNPDWPKIPDYPSRILIIGSLDLENTCIS